MTKHDIHTTYALQKINYNNIFFTLNITNLNAMISINI